MEQSQLDMRLIMEQFKVMQQQWEESEAKRQKQSEESEAKMQKQSEESEAKMQKQREEDKRQREEDKQQLITVMLQQREESEAKMQQQREEDKQQREEDKQQLITIMQQQREEDKQQREEIKDELQKVKKEVTDNRLECRAEATSLNRRIEQMCSSMKQNEEDDEQTKEMQQEHEQRDEDKELIDKMQSQEDNQQISENEQQKNYEQEDDGNQNNQLFKDMQQHIGREVHQMEVNQNIEDKEEVKLEPQILKDGILEDQQDHETRIIPVEETVNYRMERIKIAIENVWNVNQKIGYKKVYKNLWDDNPTTIKEDYQKQDFRPKARKRKFLDVRFLIGPLRKPWRKKRPRFSSPTMPAEPGPSGYVPERGKGNKHITKPLRINGITRYMFKRL